MQTINQSLPATPKSITDTQNTTGSSDTYAIAKSTDNENAVNSETTAGDDEKVEYEYSCVGDFDDSTSNEQEQFVLAPTPAQLGRAPLQRRLGSLVGSDTNSM